MRTTRLLLGAFVAFSLAACSGSPADPGGGNGGGGGSSADYNLAVVAGGGQEVEVGETAAEDLVVRLTRDGAAVSGEQVSFDLEFNCGSLSTTSATTDAGGEASTRWTASTAAGDCTVTADHANASVSVENIATPGPAELGDGVCCGGVFTGSRNYPGRFFVNELLADKYGNGVEMDLDVTGGWSVSLKGEGSSFSYVFEHETGGQGTVEGFLDGELMARGTVEGSSGGQVSLCLEMVGLAPEAEGSCED